MNENKMYIRKAEVSGEAIANEEHRSIFLADFK